MCDHDCQNSCYYNNWPQGSSGRLTWTHTFRYCIVTNFQSCPVKCQGISISLPGNCGKISRNLKQVSQRLYLESCKKVIGRDKKSRNRPWQDSNLQSPDPKSGALSIRPHGLRWVPETINQVTPGSLSTSTAILMECRTFTGFLPFSALPDIDWEL